MLEGFLWDQMSDYVCCPATNVKAAQTIYQVINSNLHHIPIFDPGCFCTGDVLTAHIPAVNMWGQISQVSFCTCHSCGQSGQTRSQYCPATGQAYQHLFTMLPFFPCHLLVCSKHNIYNKVRWGFEVDFFVCFFTGLFTIIVLDF